MDKRTVAMISQYQPKLSPQPFAKDAIKLAITNSNLLAILNNYTNDKIGASRDDNKKSKEIKLKKIKRRHLPS